jgi:hypothetical protein
VPTTPAASISARISAVEIQAKVPSASGLSVGIV